MLRVLTAGESHGPELVAVMEGLPSGVPVSRSEIQADLARRKLGYGRGSRMKFEEDELTISSGVVHGLSLGSPIALRIANTEWPKWVEVMSAEPVELTERSRGRGAALTRPRPGHADLVSMKHGPSWSAQAPARLLLGSRSEPSPARSWQSSASVLSLTRWVSARSKLPGTLRCPRRMTWRHWMPT